MIRRTIQLAALLLVVSCQPTTEGFLSIAGWAAEGQPATYDATGLWELINGAADTFLAYGFESVTVQNFSADGVTASVAVYDMGNPLNAFGIYWTESQGAEDRLSIGTDAVVSPPYQCLLLKDRYYVKVDAYEGDIDQATGEALMASIAADLPGSSDPPPEIGVLPDDGMVSGSTRYTKEDVFGLAELDECVHALYRDKVGRPFRVFVMLTPTADRADRTWSILEESWQPAELGDREAVFREVPYSGFIGAFRTDDGIVGVAEAPDKGFLMDRLEWLTARRGSAADR